MCAFQEYLGLTESSGLYQPPPAYPTKNCCSNDQLLLLRKDPVAIPDIEARDLKKICHNANERQRRRKLNELYETLRSLFPHSNTNKKKMSVPAVVNQVLKYIPQLQNQIKILSRGRDRLLAVGKISDVCPPSQASYRQPEHNEAVSFDVRRSAVEKMEVLVTVQCSRAARVLLSHLLVLFEHESLDVLNASSFVSGHMVWHNIHLKVMERGSLDLGGLRQKIALLCQKSRGCNGCRNGRLPI